MPKDFIWSLHFILRPPSLLWQSGFCMWIRSCNTLPLRSPTVLRTQCKHQVERIRLFRLYPDPVQHGITAHTIHTRNAEPLAVLNSVPLCLGLFPWNVPSVQLPSTPVFSLLLCWVLYSYSFFKAEWRHLFQENFLDYPSPTLSPLGPFLGILEDLCPSLWKHPTVMWWSGLLFTSLSPKPGPLSYTYESIIAPSTFSAYVWF